jgi:uncharacterized protein with HEPN domain
MWRDEAYVLDMLLAARKVLQFAKGVDWDRFSRDELVQNAIMRQIQIIGEAARSVSAEYQNDHAHVPWRDIIGMRNRLVHEYFQILPRRVWDVVKKDIPDLIDVLKPLVPPEPEQRPRGDGDSE